MTTIQEMLHQMVQHYYKCCNQFFYDMQYVELICVRSKEIGKIMHTHTHTEGTDIGYAVQNLPM